ncbi:MAG TPA: FAD-dependent oxidoreductase, partial [Actinomycetota bacterium]|nr:FAD-dependent oxidoreductase [Actinomycetota bacterium]
MTETADVVVVGGGVVGASTAYHLAAAGAGRVLMLEREDTLGTGSTGACAGGFRHQFSSEVNVRLSLASVPMILSFRETHGIPLDVHQDGYLFLVRSEASWRSYVAAAELQRGLGVDARLLQPEEAGALAPGISLDGIVGATFCPDDGIADPSGLTAGYATIARGAGAELRTSVEALAILTEGERITGVDTSEGPVWTDIVVNAAGPWAGLLAKTCGVALRERGMGHVMDIVPNHMGIAKSANPWWLDVLENGPSSRFARFFDIEWHPVKDELAEKVLIPILGDQYGEVLENQELKLAYRDGAFFVRYYEETLPLAPDTYEMVVADDLGDWLSEHRG